MSRGAEGPGSGATLFGLTAQKSRAVAYLVAGLLAGMAKLGGSLETTYRHIFEVVGVAEVSCIVASVYYVRRTSPRWDRAVNLGWIFLDVALITASVRFTGGASSPWYPWYLAPLSAAAFLEGFLVVAVVAVTTVAAYAGVIVLGEPSGSTPETAVLVLRLLNVHAAAIVFLAGVVDLKRKRAAIRRLKDDETRKVGELARLTAALDQRTRELAEANERIEDANRAKSKFLAAMSHELRTPLNSIIGFSEILLNVPTCPPEKRTRFLTNVHGAGQHLLGLINDILDLSKVEAGRMDLSPEPLAVGDLVKGVVAVMKGVAEKKSVRVVAEVPGPYPALHADAVRVKQIVFNLASNAVKFSPDGGQVTCAVRALPAGESPLGEEAIEIAVSDQGSGIAPEHLAVIFEEFRQVSDGTSRRHEGTGLGLSLVKRFVELHRGLVQVESDPGKGSTFRAVLPCAFRGGSEPPPRPVSGPTPGRRVVVLEEDATSWESTSEALARGGYLPVRARREAEAVELLRTLRPVAVALDPERIDPRAWKSLQQVTKEAGVPVVRSSEAALVTTLDELLRPSDPKIAREPAEGGRPT